MGANAVTSVPVYQAADVLTAANLNITNSGIPVFSGTATRDAAFGGSGEKTLAEGQFAFLEDSNSTQFYDGAAWQPVATAPQFAMFHEAQASGTDGGTFTSGAWQKRVLNTTVSNTITGCSIASSVITLPAGTYKIQGTTPWWGNTGIIQPRFENTTDSISYLGQAGNGSAGIGMVFGGYVEAIFTITGSKNFELQHRLTSTVATNGFGIGANFGVSTIFSTLCIEKIG
jgi:hypothetical protein